MLVASRVNLGWVRSSLREGNYRPPQKKISMSRELPALPGIWENECLIFQGIWVRPDSIHHHMEEQRASVKESVFNAGDLGLIPGLGRSPGKGKGYPLQCLPL